MTPDQLQAFLDDLARLSYRHGVKISGIKRVAFTIVADANPGGYAAEQSPVGVRVAAYPIGESKGPMAPHYIVSVDIGEMSNHEKMKIMGGKV